MSRDRERDLAGLRLRREIQAQPTFTVADLLRLMNADQVIDCQYAREIAGIAFCRLATAQAALDEVFEQELAELDFSRWYGNLRPYKLTPAGRQRLKTGGEV